LTRARSPAARPISSLMFHGQLDSERPLCGSYIRAITARLWPICVCRRDVSQSLSQAGAAGARADSWQQKAKRNDGLTYPPDAEHKGQRDEQRSSGKAQAPPNRPIANANPAKLAAATAHARCDLRCVQRTATSHQIVLAYVAAERFLVRAPLSLTLPVLSAHPAESSTGRVCASVQYPNRRLAVCEGGACRRRQSEPYRGVCWSEGDQCGMRASCSRVRCLHFTSSRAMARNFGSFCFR
jgi:hypothetical protein